jgi:hypothetical protein
MRTISEERKARETLRARLHRALDMAFDRAFARVVDVGAEELRAADTALAKVLAAMAR